MRKKQKEQLERSQKSVSYTPDDILSNRTDVSSRVRYYDAFFPHMFIEDVRLRILPNGGRAWMKELEISLDPPDPRAQQLIEKAISPDGHHHNFAGAICHFIANCAVHLLIYETDTCEIVYLSEPENGKTVGFELVPINPYTILYRGNSLSQFLPDDHSTNLRERRRMELRPEHTLTFKLPAGIRGKLDAVMESMSILGPTSPEFFMKELEAGSRKTLYDVARHQHLRNVALARITRDLGWDARGSLEKEVSEYYLVYRHIKFERFKIELRDSILDTLNAGLDLAGRQLGFSTKITLKGLPTFDDVQTAHNHLAKGDVPFGEILQPFRDFQAKH